MPAPTTNSKSQTILQQVTNNTTSWIGHRPGDKNEIIGGQTFTSPKEGDLDGIEVIPAMVTTPGKVMMTVHSFDPQNKIWGPALGSTSIEINKDDTGKWVRFNIPGLHINQGKTYGFRLECPDTLMGMAEAAGSHKTPPFSDGQEWRFNSGDKKGHSFSYFSLAFKIGLRA